VYAKFHQNCPSFVKDIMENNLVSFFPGHSVEATNTQEPPPPSLKKRISGQEMDQVHPT